MQVAGAGPGVVSLLGVSPSGRRIALATRDGPRSRLRLLSLQDRSLQDFGTIRYHCRVRWDEEDRFWAYARTAEFGGWTEFDARSGRATGNTKPQNVEAGAMCPSLETAPDILKRVVSVEAELWRVPIDD